MTVLLPVKRRHFRGTAALKTAPARRLPFLRAVLFTAAFLASAVVHGASVTIDASVDGDLKHFGGLDIDTTSDRVTTFSSGNNRRFSILEFNLASIPDNVTIDAVSLRLTTFGSLTNTPANPTVTLRVFGYADAFADGAVTVDDKPSNNAVHGALVATEVYNKTDNGGPAADTVLLVPLSDVSAVADAVVGLTTDFFGVVFETDNFATIRFHSLENVGQPVPALVVDYTLVPVPPALPLLGSALLGLTLTRRRA